MLKAVADRIIIQLEENKNNTLIYTGKENLSNRGTVISVGPQVKGVCCGDKIIFHRFDELPLPEKNQVVVRENSVLGIYSE